MHNAVALCCHAESTVLLAEGEFMPCLQGAIHFEDTQPGEDHAERVLDLYKRAIAGPSATTTTSALSDADREELSERSVTFADLHSNAATVEQTAAAHALLVRSLAPKADAKKRAAEASPAAGGSPLHAQHGLPAECI